MTKRKSEGPRLDPSPAFREAIDRLAHEAREQDRAAEEEARKNAGKKPFSAIVIGGLALILAQLGLLAYLLIVQRGDAVPARTGPEPPPRRPATCGEVVNRTYWRVLAYDRDKGHLPEKLEDLLGGYITAMPADPVTGKTLSYSVDGEHFTLRCPEAAR